MTDPCDDALETRLTAIHFRRAALERRLEDGYRRIETALGEGADTESWETFWLRLLAEYEAVCDQAAAA